MAASPDVLVIGGGVIGLTAAFELATAGLSVEVCDRSDLGREASWAGAGIIPPGNFPRAVSSLDRLRADSSSRFAGTSQKLLDLTGTNIGYRVCGGIEFLTSDDADILELWKNEGIACEQMNDSDLPASVLNPPACQPYWLPGMAQVRNPWFLRSLMAACQSMGVKLSPHWAAESLSVLDSRIEEIIFSNGERRSASHYLIASGAWSEQLLTPLGCRLGVHPVRGQIVLYRTEEKLFDSILAHGSRYIVPRGDGRLLAGSTEEPAAGFRNETTEAGIGELRKFTESLVPELRTAIVEKTWSGLRPGSRDGWPVIGFVPGFDNALTAVGHFRSGIQLSLGTAAMVADLILKRPPVVDPAPFRLDRPVQPASKPAFRS